MRSTSLPTSSSGPGPRLSRTPRPNHHHRGGVQGGGRLRARSLRSGAGGCGDVAPRTRGFPTSSRCSTRPTGKDARSTSCGTDVGTKPDASRSSVPWPTASCSGEPCPGLAPSPPGPTVARSGSMTTCSRTRGAARGMADHGRDLRAGGQALGDQPGASVQHGPPGRHRPSPGGHGGPANASEDLREAQYRHRHRARGEGRRARQDVARWPSGSRSGTELRAREPNIVEGKWTSWRGWASR